MNYRTETIFNIIIRNGLFLPLRLWRLKKVSLKSENFLRRLPYIAIQPLQIFIRLL